MSKGPWEAWVQREGWTLCIQLACLPTHHLRMSVDAGHRELQQGSFLSKSLPPLCARHCLGSEENTAVKGMEHVFPGNLHETGNRQNQQVGE